MSPGDATVVVEVTDTLGIDFTTGIQRVVREVVAGLSQEPGIDVVPVVTAAPGRPMRRLTDEEARRLATHPAGGRAGRRADDLGPLAPIARRVGDLPPLVRARVALARWRARRRPARPLHPELEYRPPPGAVFLDIEGSWYDPTPRSELLPELRGRGVHTMAFVHDVMPVVHPEWFTPLHRSVYRDWIEAHLRHTERFLTNSQHTASELRDVAARSGTTVEPVVVPLGGDLEVRDPRPVPLPDRMERFLLVVGTLEPRKNQELVLDAFERLLPRHPDLGLVLVGKEGWMVDRLVARLRRHPERDRRLLWLGGVHDEELEWLYQHAFLCVAPSRYEGLGVPVREALARGRATLASTGGAQPEAAGGAAELFDPDDLDGLVRLVARHLEDPEHHAARERAAAAHRTPTWAETTAVVAEQVRELVTGTRPGDR